MKTRLLITAVALTLVGCRDPLTMTYRVECTALQQAEQQNAEDLEAYCFTEQTQSSLKCEQAKSKKLDLKAARNWYDKRWDHICQRLQF